MKKKATQYIILCFSIILFIIYPLYNKGSYIGIDEAKYACLKIIAGIGFVFALAGIGVQLCVKSIPNRVKMKLSLTDSFVLIYAAMVTISMFISSDTYTAKYGWSGWYMGGFLILASCAAYSFISRFGEWNSLCVYALLVGSFLVFWLGILNRFDIWPLSMEGSEHNGFISTIGNIGWFCGFYAVTATVGVAVYFFNDHLDDVKRVLLSVYLLVAFAIGLAQGADSIILYFVVLFASMIYFVYLRKNIIYRWMELAIMWCASAQMIHLLRTIWPRRFRYDSANFCNFLDNRMMTFWILILLAAVYFGMRYCDFAPGNHFKAACKIIPVCVAAGILLFAIIAVAYTKTVGGGVESNIYQYDEFLFQKLLRRLFYIDGGWGSGRGATINAGVMIFKDMPLINKLFGVGSDCFASYAYMNNSIASYLDIYFSGAMLTNAHCEPITSLVNQGILGTIAYYGIFASYIIRSIKSEKVSDHALCISIVAICYVASNLLNYTHILNLPIMFVLLGWGQAPGSDPRA